MKFLQKIKKSLKRKIANRKKSILSNDSIIKIFTTIASQQELLSITSLLGTTIATNFFFRKIKDPSDNTLITTNKIMGIAHALIAGFMYYGRPKPTISDIVGLKENNTEFLVENLIFPTFSSIKEILGDKTNIQSMQDVINYIDKYFTFVNDPNNDFVFVLSNDIYSIFDVKNNTYSLSKKIYIIDENDKEKEENEGEPDYFTLVLLENKKLLLHDFNDQEFDNSNNLENYKYFNFRSLDWGWKIRNDVKIYNTFGDTPFIYKKTKENDGTINVWDSCVAFSALTSIFHFSFAYIYPKRYKKWMEQKRNPMRWIEYSITSGIMMLNLGSTSGVTDRNDLISLFAMTALTNIFGMAIEESYGKVTKSIFMISGFISFIIPWFFIFDEYNKIYREFKDNGLLDILQSENPDAYNLLTLLAPVAISVMGFLYFLFPAIQINQIIYPNKYKTGEFSFIITSFISKISLNILAYYLGNRPSISYIRESCGLIEDNTVEKNDEDN
jgi:hypothetical protein